MKCATRPTRSLAVGIALSLAPLAATGAQARFNAGIGAAIPIGASADEVNPGYSMLVSFAMRPHFFTRNQLRFEFGSNSLPERAVPNVSRSVLTGTANLVIIRDPAARPLGYSIVGFGTYQKSGSVPRRSSQGVNLGAGMQFTLGFFGAFLEARLHYIHDANKTKYFPMTFGLTF